MKILSRIALIRLFIATLLVFTHHFALAESKIPYEVNEQQVIHLNNSTVAQLLTLKGIGEKKAQAIVNYRKQVGNFKTIEDLMKVKGIGEKVLLDNKSRLKI
ncbi:MAG: ComEA family DNA-binding protein [Colwellia sp.]|nr:ComEA family DNA-binding protein [Colwellia sp.]MCW8863459.1 ComEA family DNA-binding protein [Colwellia sp.]MCW9082848.1 ComEA family DNA-binding protein [Colwellia sp.]